MKKGVVYIAGAGCGDYELITIKLERIIKEVDCIVYDRLVNENLLNLAKESCELIYLGKGNTEGGLIQDEINNTLVKKAFEGKDVLRLKGGHPFVFGRGGEEIIALEENDISFEVIPGITSAISVPAYAGIPISHRGINTSFHIFTGHTKKDGKWIDFETVAKLGGTLVFLMGVKNLAKIVSGLVDNGKSLETPIALIENGTTSKQRTTVGKLINIVEIAVERKVNPPAIIIIGEVVSLRETMQWFENKEFFGKRILVTRNKEQAGKFSHEIRKLGGEPYELPFIDIVYQDAKLTDLSDYKVLLFNSANAVRGFFRILKDIRQISHIKIGAVGVKTEEELLKNKLIPDFVPEEYLGELLAKESVNYTESGDKILVLTSDRSPFQEGEFSEKYKRHFEKLVVYETRKINREKNEVEEYINKTDYLTFLSASTFEAFIESINFDKELLKSKKIVSIGPMTSKEIKKHGIKVDIEAEQYTVEGIIEKLKD